MSAPDTNVKKQERRHKPALLGMKGVVIFAGLLLAALLVWTFAQSDEEAASGGTGAVVATE